MNEELENKVRGIVGLYNFYKHNMTTPQRVGILTLWIEVSVSKEEYEVANALQLELNRIINGDEEFFYEPPLPITYTSTSYTHSPIFNDIDVSYGEPIKTLVTKEKKKLKFTSHWGSGSFTLINLSFGDFKFIVLNFGLEMK